MVIGYVAERKAASHIQPYLSAVNTQRLPKEDKSFFSSSLRLLHWLDWE